MSWSVTEEKRKEKRIKKTPFLRSVIPRGKNVFLEGIGLVSGFGESRDLVLSPSRSDLVVQSSRFDELVGNREVYNLSMVSGPVFEKIKGKCWMFIPLQVKKRKIKRNSLTRSVVCWSPEL